MLHHSSHTDPVPPFAPEMLDLLPVQTAFVDEAGVIRYANQAWRAFARQSALFEVGSSYLAHWPDAGSSVATQELRERFHRLLQGDSGLPMHAVSCEGRNGIVWLEVRMATLPPGSGSGIIVTHVDASTRRRGEPATPEAVRFPAELLGEHACLSVDSQWRVTSMNPAAERILHRSAADLSGRVIWDEFPQSAGTEAWKTALDAMDRRVPATLPLCSGLDGQILEIRLVPTPDGLSAFLRDISGWVHTEQELRKREEFFRNAFHASFIGTAILGLDGQILQVNSSFCQLTGYPEEQLLTFSLQTITHPDDMALSDRMLQRLTRGEIPRYQIVKRYLHREGEVVWVLLSGSLLRDANGDPQHIVIQVQDISSRKRAEEELRRQALTFENISDGVVFTHKGGVILDWNPAAERILGYARDEILERNFDVLVSSRQAGLLGHIQEELTQLRRWQGEIVLHRKDGRECVCETVVAPLMNEHGKPVACVFVLRDVTESRHLEAQLRQAQKMEAVGRLAGGVAHDFNNLLTVVKGYSELLLADLDEDSAHRPRVHEIRRAAERAASLTRQLLAYSRRQVLAPRLLDLCQVVANLAPMLRRLIGEDINLVSNLPSGSLWVKADPGQIDQVILNLVVNARDAIPQSGTIAIELTTQSEWAQRMSGGQVLPPGSYVVLAVRDTGIGMDQETQAHIFEPFFTTKEKGQGTGLGLATVYGIVRQSGGYIQVNSIPGKGSCFTIYLPRAEAPQEDSVPAAAPARATENGRETILVVEDEEGVRALICDVLGHHGYRVLEAGNSQEALQHAVQHAGRIDLMITDVVMPRMGGRELAQRMASLRPRMQVLYISGYTDDAVVRHGVLESQMAFLQKPFSPGQLRQKVRELLSENQRALKKRD